MKKPYPRWKDLRETKLTPAQLERLDRAVERELVEMNLHAIRELVGQTQEEVAAVIDMSQSEVSHLERRQDVRLSTLRRFVEALGGELEVCAAFGDERVRLWAAV